MATRSIRMRLILPLAGMAMLQGAPAWAQAADRSIGVWSNPQNSVHVRSDHCGKSMCGTVVWANDKAKADARKAGTPDIIGLQLFRDFSRDKNGEWRGKVFVPDIRKTFHGTIRIIDENTLAGTGCLIGRVGCRTQTWKRIG
jgi:uncharacterized protein (DUF2147 family)